MGSLLKRIASCELTGFMPMDRHKALSVVTAALGKIPPLRKANAGSAEHTAFVQTTGMQLARVFGPQSPITLNFSAITYHDRGGWISNVIDLERDQARRAAGAYQSGLTAAEGVLLSASEILQEEDAEQILRASRVREIGAKVFLSHGHAPDILARVENYIRSLGLQPVVVVRGPSEGLSVDNLVERRMGECDCAIIIATADDVVGATSQPRPNVLHEIGMAQQRLSNRVIYLKERDCSFPSNIAPKVWEDFSRDNLEKAFEKIAKELRAFGLL